MYNKFKRKSTLFYQARIKQARLKKSFYILLFVLLTTIYLAQEFIILVNLKNEALLPNYPAKTWLVFTKTNPSNLKRGDLVVYQSQPEASFIKELLRFPIFLLSLGFFDIIPSHLSVRRVLALPEDRIFIKNKSIYLNGKLHLPSNLVKFNDTRVIPEAISPRDNLSERFIPKKKIFVISDYWDYLSDSRNTGLVDSSQIKGKLWKKF